MGNNSRINSVSTTGLLAGVLAAVSYFLIHDKGCLLSDTDKVQYIHIAAAVGGAVLLIIGLLGLTSGIRDMMVLYYVITILMLVAAGVLFWAAYMEFFMVCESLTGTFNKLINRESNIFKNEEGKMIAVFIMDIIAGLLYLSAAGAYARF